MDSESHENERGRERSISSWAARARRARPILGLVATGALALGGGCTTFDGLTATAPEPTGVSSSSSSGEGGAGGAGGTSSAGGAGGGGGTAGVGGAGGAGGAGNSKCADPALKAPLMVGVASSNGASYCIDTTEVTREQYATFLATTPELNQPPPCDGNMSYIPEAEWPPKPNQKSFPVIGVDFCDASAYCEWAGKRLCGAIGGGGTNLDGGEDPMTSQWLNACSSGGTLTYPYGDLYDGKTCNGLDFGAGGPIKVQSAMMCVGSVMELFDMSGNVREWEDACDGSECRVRGGSFDSDSAADGELPCAGATTLDRFATDDFTGFRCCKD